MTMRTYKLFACPDGHQGEEKTTENDQPYSKCWESIGSRASETGQMAAIYAKCAGC